MKRSRVRTRITLDVLFRDLVAPLDLEEHPKSICTGEVPCTGEGSVSGQKNKRNRRTKNEIKKKITSGLVILDELRSVRLLKHHSSINSPKSGHDRTSLCYARCLHLVYTCGDLLNFKRLLVYFNFSLSTLIKIII